VAIQTALFEEHPKNPDYLSDVGISLSNLASCYLDLGEYEQGLKTGLRALEYKERFARAYPRQAQEDYQQSTLLSTLMHLGGAYKKLHQPGQAVGPLSKAAQVAEGLVRRSPGVPRYRTLLAEAYGKLSEAYTLSGRPEQAEQTTLQLYRELDRLVRSYPEESAYRRGVAVAVNSLAVRYEQTGRFQHARQLYERAIALLRSLCADQPNDTELRHNLVHFQVNISYLYRKTRQFDRAAQALRAAMADLRAVKGQAVTLEQHRGAEANVHLNLGSLYRQTGKRDRALEHLATSHGMWKKLATERPKTAFFAIGLGESALELGHLHRAGGAMKAATECYGAAIETLKDTLTRHGPDAEARHFLVAALESRALTLEALGRQAEALADWGQALDRAAPSERPRLRLGRARARSRAGQLEEAVTEAEACAPAGAPAELCLAAARVLAEAAGLVEADPRLPLPRRDQLARRFGGRAVQLLRQARTAGLKEPAAALAGDPALAALRRRDDFRRLLGEQP
jgi:tetratricopeptide (TPR) repeat protein